MITIFIPFFSQSRSLSPSPSPARAPRPWQFALVSDPQLGLGFRFGVDARVTAKLA